ncbi:Eisosome component PIL1-domain-containing protein [Dissophora ornata]|nr:Eisosome component PIL1-domain-containing protein [Dissophora ornata]
MNKWLAEMKNIDSSLKTLDKEISADAKLIAAWGTTEGDDLADVCQRMSQLMEEMGLIQQAYSLRHTAYRKTIKSMKVQEMTLDENRKKKHELTTQIAKLQKSAKENPIKMMELQAALDRVTAELLHQELELMQIKRVTVKEAFDAKFDAMLEYAEKMALIAGYGRAITFVVDTETQVADRMRIYNGGEYTAAAVNQVKSAITSWQPQPVNAAVRPAVAPSQDELALSAAAAAYNSKTPPFNQTYAANDGYSSSHNDGLDHTADIGLISPQSPPASSDHGFNAPLKNKNADQISLIQEQQRLLEQEQQRLYQQNLATYSPERSPSQLHYQDAASGSSNGGAGGGFTPGMPRRNDTQELYPPTLPVYESSSSTPQPGYNGYSQPPYTQYESSTYQNGAPARNYRLGFVDPRERDQMENDRYKAEYTQNGHPSLPPLHFAQSPILNEK